MRRATTFTQRALQRTLGHTRAGHGVGVRLATLRAAAAVLVNELTPAARWVVGEIAEMAQVDPWVVLREIIERDAASVLAPGPRST